VALLAHLSTQDLLNLLLHYVDDLNRGSKEIVALLSKPKQLPDRDLPPPSHHPGNGPERRSPRNPVIPGALSGSGGAIRVGDPGAGTLRGLARRGSGRGDRGVGRYGFKPSGRGPI